MIVSFNCKETKSVFERVHTRRFSAKVARPALRKLLILDAANVIEDLRIPPSNRLEKLVGDRQGQYSIRVNLQWRICFSWNSGSATNVEIVDYH